MFKSQNKNSDQAGDLNIEKDTIDLNKYIDSEGLTMQKIRTGWWFIAHRKHFRLMLVLMLIAIICVTYAYSFYQSVYYVTKGVDEDTMLLTQITSNDNNYEYLMRNTPVDLVVISAVSVGTGDGRYDLIGHVKNLNLKHVGFFDYCFQELVPADSSMTGHCSSDFILPGEEKYILLLAQDFAQKPGVLDLVVEQSTWRRTGSYRIEDWDGFVSARTNFIVSNTEITEQSANSDLQRTPYSTLSFDLKNGTIFNFWELPLSIIMFNGSQIVGVNKYIVDKLTMDEFRHIKISWAGTLRAVNNIQIIPNLDITKEDIYMNIRGETGQQK